MQTPIGKSCPISGITNKWRHLQTNPNGSVVIFVTGTHLGKSIK